MLSKVRSGDRLRIPSADYNAMIDAAVANKLKPRVSKTPPKNRTLKNASGVSVYNQDEEEEIPEFGVVDISTLFITDTEDDLVEFQNCSSFIAKKPDESTGTIWGVVQGPLGKGDFGYAIVSGVTVCKINLLDEGDTNIEATSGSYIPDSGSSGLGTIVWVAGGVGTADATGEQWAVIRLGGGGGGGPLLTPQYQGQFLGAPTANTLAACYPFAVNVV